MGGEEIQEEEWTRCQVIRHLGANQCVIRIAATGAILPIKLKSPIDAARAALLSGLTPADANVRLGHCEKEWFVDCELADVQWTERHSYPPPRTYRKRPRE
jgi:hypothetical protein